MPNWATSKLVITGDDEQLDELIEQVSTPYEQIQIDWQTKEETTEIVQGNFLLWNIIRPTNLDAYYQRGEYANKPNKSIEPVTEQRTPEQILSEVTEALDGLADYISNPPDGLIEQIQDGFRTGMDWYNWNVRNWGTKWEIGSDNAYVQRQPRAVQYELTTAWSPPVEALDNLAKQYPTLALSLVSIDEGDLFAVEVAWNNGNRLYEIDLPITHELNEKLHGYCWACEEGLEELDGEDFDEDRHNNQVEYKCRDSQNIDLEMNLEFGNE
jgi:hypothetical protein